MVSRRAFVFGGAAAVVLAVGGAFAAVEEGALPGKLRLAALTGACDVDATAPKSVSVVESGSFSSSARKTTVGWSVATPPGVPVHGLPVALVLHGRGCDHTTAFSELRLQDFLAAYVAGGGRPLALASVNGGANTYWHPRADGDNPLAMLDTEFVPLLADRGFAVDRVGVLGWSMGGYGALLVARESHRGMLKNLRVGAVSAASPALFSSYKASAGGAFDNAADFATYGDLLADPDVGTTPLYVSCGADDAFTAETKRYRRAVSPTPAGGISKGCHTDGYWRSVAPEQLSFVGQHLG